MDQNGTALLPQNAEDMMKKHFEETQWRTEDFDDEHHWTDDVDPVSGYTTEEWELDGTGKQNCIDLCDE